MRWRTRTAVVSSGVGVAALALMAWAGVAAAVSGGGYSPDQQDCTPNADAWSTPAGYTEPGCHNVAVNVESGGQTNGDANSNNTRYFEFGGNQLPITNEPATPTVLGLGYPGQDNSEHAGCIAFDTNGTGGGTGTGCGTGTGGLGAEINYDYYNTIQPGYSYSAGPIPVPDPTATKTPGGPPVTITPDTNVSGVGGPSNVVSTFLTQGLQVYFGQDDNTDAGEHDGVSGVEGQCPQSSPGTVCHSAGVVNGPSDGGSMLLSIEPQWLLAPTNPSASHPEGLVNYSEGFCADGICSGITTQQQKVYNGCVSGNAGNPHDECLDGTAQNGNVYDNNTPSSTQESGNCSSGDANSESCNNNGLDVYRQGTPTNMYAEPGIQTYQDPDPQRSPAAPFATPGTYVGTCGATVNDSGGYGEPGIFGFFTGTEAPAQSVQNPTDPACSY